MFVDAQAKPATHPINVQPKNRLMTTMGMACRCFLSMAIMLGKMYKRPNIAISIIPSFLKIKSAYQANAMKRFNSLGERPVGTKKTDDDFKFSVGIVIVQYFHRFDLSQRQPKYTSKIWKSKVFF